MRVYRYEKPDGGGPWFTRDGSPRGELPRLKDYENVIYGFLSLQSLFDFFKDHGNEVDMKDCEIKTYEVPQEDIEIMRNTSGYRDEVIFPKTYEPIY